MERVSHFPKEGLPFEDILKTMQEYRVDDTDWRKGRAFSLVYHVSDSYSDFLKKAHNLYFSENGLNPMAFKSLKRFEHESVKMASEIFNGDENTVGTLTSGGTESLLLAIKTYRDRARKLKPWIRNPEVVVPNTIHPAVEKAGSYFDVKIVHAPIGLDFKANIPAMKKLINRNTILLMGSAPQYPHGVIDPIIELSELALESHLPLHIDACIGGFILPFVEKLGYPIEPFDFRVKGVTSISADVHKYGYAAKGASILLYRSMDYMKHQFYVYENWPGGIYASPTILGTKAGGSIAAAWAALKAMGEDGYLRETKKIMDVVELFKKEIQSIPEIKLTVPPDMSLVSYQSKDTKFSIYAVADCLEEKGWKVDRQQKPESIHLTIAPHHVAIIPEYVKDLKEAVLKVKANPDLAQSGQAAMYGMMAKVPFRSMIKSSVQKIMEDMYGKDGKMPEAKSDEVKNWGDFAEKVGMQVLDVKDKVEDIAMNVKKKLIGK